MYIAIFIVLNILIQLHFSANDNWYFSVFKYNDFYFTHPFTWSILFQPTLTFPKPLKSKLFLVYLENFPWYQAEFFIKNRTLDKFLTDDADQLITGIVRNTGNSFPHLKFCLPTHFLFGGPTAIDNDRSIIA